MKNMQTITAVVLIATGITSSAESAETASFGPPGRN